jgi:F-type H+-transporting ATPase subunit gamma
MAERFIARERAAGRETSVLMIGKKGIARFRFRKIPVEKGITTIGDNPEWRDAEELSREFLPRFEAGEIDRVVIVGTRYFSSSRHEPLEIQLLPFPAADPPIVPPGTIGAPGGKGSPDEVEFIYEPDRSQVLEALVPVAVKYALYRVLLEARASEHVARRVAMKTATDNAETMIRVYTTSYNRQRQAGITQQIVEVVSGADALD